MNTQKKVKFSVILCIVLVPFAFLASRSVYATTETFEPAIASMDGILFASDYNYTIAHDKSDANQVYDGIDTIQIDNDNVTTYEIKRSVVMFSTQTIPDDAPIVSAILSLYVKDKNQIDSGHADCYIVNGSATHFPLVASDYGTLKDETTSGGNITYGSIVTGQYNNITLNAVGRSWINKTGFTKLALRTKGDIDNVTPTSENWVDFWSYEKGEGYRPKLYVIPYYSVTIGPFTIESTSSIASNGTWNDIDEILTFWTNGTVYVDVGNYGQPLKIEVAATAWTDWTYDSTAQRVTITNVASEVVLFWKEEEVTGGGGGAYVPPEEEPPPPTPVIPTPKPPIGLMGAGIIIIIAVVGIAVFWEQYQKQPKISRVRRKWRTNLKSGEKRSVKWKTGGQKSGSWPKKSKAPKGAWKTKRRRKIRWKRKEDWEWEID